MKKINIIMFSLILFLTGCSVELKNIPDGYKIGKEKDAVVFGEIVFHPSVYQYPEEVFIKSLEGDITVEKIDDGKLYNIRPFKTGKKYLFSVSLPEGKYKITSVRWGSVTAKHPAYHFDVKEKGSLYYIGDFKLSIDDEYIYPLIIGELFSNFYKRINLNVEIIDLFEEAQLTFRQKYKNINGESIKALVTKES